jgi:hypothetical protein
MSEVERAMVEAMCEVFGREVTGEALPSRRDGGG